MLLRLAIIALITTCWTATAARSNPSVHQSTPPIAVLKTWTVSALPANMATTGNAVALPRVQEMNLQEYDLQERSAKTQDTQTPFADKIRAKENQAIVEWYKYIDAQKRVIQYAEPQPMIHPLTWCGMNLMLLAGALAWSSNEWEWSELSRSLRVTPET